LSRCLTAPVRQHDIRDNDIKLAFGEFGRFPDAAHSLDIVSASSEHQTDHRLIAGVVLD
jgi:hypothetical protein